MRHSTPERAASTTLTKSNWFDLSDTKYKEKGIMMSEQCNPSVGQSNQNDALQRKRVRAGSISGRLRTASDLEEIGLIDKFQKGYIKDLIISGDSTFQAVMEKYEKGDKKELEDLIRSGYLGRKQSIDLLDDLDFDFLNGMKADLDVNDAFGEDFMFDFSDQPQQYASHGNNTASGGVGTSSSHANVQSHPHKARTSSVDSFSFFENLPYDANNANSLMDELQYLNRQYGEAPVGSPRSSGSGGPTNNAPSTAAQASTGAPHVSFSRYVSSMGLDPNAVAEENAVGGTLTGHKGRRDSWDIAAQYIQQEEDQVRANGSKSGGVGASSWTHPKGNAMGQGGVGGNSAGAFTNKAPGLASRKTNVKAEPGVSSGSGSGGGAKQGGGASMRPMMGCGLLFAAPGTSGSSSSGAGALGSQSGRSLGTTGGTSTSTQHSAHGTACASYLQSGAGALGGSTGAYDEMAQRIGSVGFVGAYSPEQRRLRIEKFIEKRGRRVWTKKVKYDVRKNFADSRLRVKGRFVKKEDEDIMREILSI